MACLDESGVLVLDTLLAIAAQSAPSRNDVDHC
jgi:hypothetical protein